MSDVLDKVDEVAASLVKMYQREGEFCIVIRTNADNKNLRVIMPQVDATLASELLTQASECIFNGTLKHVNRIQ